MPTREQQRGIPEGRDVERTAHGARPRASGTHRARRNMDKLQIEGEEEAEGLKREMRKQQEA